MFDELVDWIAVAIGLLGVVGLGCAFAMGVGEGLAR